MARPIKRTVDYFPHDSNASNKKTLSILFNNFGHEGMSVWWMLLEFISGTENHFIDTRNPCDMEFLASKMRVTVDRLSQIVNKLADIDAIDAQLWYENRIIWSQNFINRISDVYFKRGQVAPQKPLIINGMVVSDTDNCVSDTDNTVFDANLKQDVTEMRQIKLNKIIKKNNTSKKFDAPQNSELLEESKRFSEWFKTLLPEEQKTTDTDLKNWAECYVQLLEIDKRSKKEISRICTFARNDDFWTKNFLSPLKLRRKDKSGVLYYDVLKAAMDNGRQNTRSPASLPETEDVDNIPGPNTPENIERLRRFKERQARIAALDKERLEKEKAAEVQ